MRKSKIALRTVALAVSTVVLSSTVGLAAPASAASGSTGSSSAVPVVSASLPKSASSFKPATLMPANPKKWRNKRLLKYVNDRLPNGAGQPYIHPNETQTPCLKDFNLTDQRLSRWEANNTVFGAFAMSYMRDAKKKALALVKTPEYRKASKLTKKRLTDQAARTAFYRFLTASYVYTCLNDWDNSVRPDGSGSVLNLDDVSLLAQVGIDINNPKQMGRLAAVVISGNFAVNGYLEPYEISLWHAIRNASRAGEPLPITGFTPKPYLVDSFTEYADIVLGRADRLPD